MIFLEMRNTQIFCKWRLKDYSIVLIKDLKENDNKIWELDKSCISVPAIKTIPAWNTCWAKYTELILFIALYNMQPSKNSRIKGQSICKWISNPCFLGIFSAKFGLHWKELVPDYYVTIELVNRDLLPLQVIIMADVGD